MKKASQYKGKLAKPMRPLPRMGLLAAIAIERDGFESNDPVVIPVRKAIDRRVAERMERMELLCDHYQVARGDWSKLAVALASAHVPGLQTMKDRPGAKLKWAPLDIGRLQASIEAVVLERGCTPTHAARILIKQEPWSKMAKTASTLLRRSQTDNPLWFKIFTDAVRYQVGKVNNEPLTLADIARVN